MSRKAHGQVRRSQVITTYGPGALIDLPKHSGIVGGLETWPKTGDLEEIVEPRLTRKLQMVTGVATPRLFAPPPEGNLPGKAAPGIDVWRFPQWFVVQEVGEKDLKNLKDLLTTYADELKLNHQGEEAQKMLNLLVDWKNTFVRVVPVGMQEEQRFATE